MHEYLQVAKAVAREAGTLMLESFGPSTPHTLKDDSSPITEADIRINEMVIARLAQAFPEHSLMGEEGQQLQSSTFVWVFDPIDGTVPYLRGIPTNVFALALVEDGDPILGIIYDPYTKRLYHATRGGGAYCNDTPITTSGRTDFSRSYVVTGGYRSFLDLTFFERMRDADVRFFSYGSAVYGQMLVASGQIEGTVLPGHKPWDVAAAKILIEEAGGTTSNIWGKPQRYDSSVDGFIAGATVEYHEKLLALMMPSLKQN